MEKATHQPHFETGEITPLRTPCGVAKVPHLPHVASPKRIGRPPTSHPLWCEGAPHLASPKRKGRPPAAHPCGVEQKPHLPRFASPKQIERPPPSHSCGVEKMPSLPHVGRNWTNRETTPPCGVGPAPHVGVGGWPLPVPLNSAADRSVASLASHPGQRHAPAHPCADNLR